MNPAASDPQRLFHFVLPAAWNALEASGAAALEPASLAAEGFVHLSFSAQLAGTLDAHFADTPAVWLFEVELESSDGLVVEPSRGGALFPHLYRPLKRSELARRWRLEPGPEGWTAPQHGTRWQADVPAAEAVPPRR